MISNIAFTYRSIYSKKAMSKNGGLQGWEPIKAHKWLEVLNPTEMFQNIVVRHEYVECTRSAIAALVCFMKLNPRHRKKELDNLIAKAVYYIEGEQMPDGSWYGKWGICFMYGTFFALRGLSVAGKNYYNSPTVRKATEFFAIKSTIIGSLGRELSFKPSKGIYTSRGKQNKFGTDCMGFDGSYLCWAEVDPTPLHRAVKVLINNQMENGDFPQQEITGAFLSNCMLHYGAYRNYFPLWALAEYRHKVPCRSP